MSYDSVVPLVCKHPDDTTLPQLGALHLHIAKRKTPPLAEKTSFQRKHVSITTFSTKVFLALAQGFFFLKALHPSDAL